MCQYVHLMEKHLHTSLSSCILQLLVSYHSITVCAFYPMPTFLFYKPFSLKLLFNSSFWLVVQKVGDTTAGPGGTTATAGLPWRFCNAAVPQARQPKRWYCHQA